jgi:hypothetical protein
MDPMMGKPCHDTRDSMECRFTQLLKVEFAVCFTVTADARVLDVRCIRREDDCD